MSFIYPSGYDVAYGLVMSQNGQVKIMDIKEQEFICLTPQIEVINPVVTYSDLPEHTCTASSIALKNKLLIYEK